MHSKASMLIADKDTFLVDQLEEKVDLNQAKIEFFLGLFQMHTSFPFD